MFSCAAHAGGRQGTCWRLYLIARTAVNLLEVPIAVRRLSKRLGRRDESTIASTMRAMTGGLLRMLIYFVLQDIFFLQVSRRARNATHFGYWKRR